MSLPIIISVIHQDIMSGGSAGKNDDIAAAEPKEAVIWDEYTPVGCGLEFIIWVHLFL